MKFNQFNNNKQLIMKKSLCMLTLLVAATLIASAQDRPIKFGLKAGLNLPTISAKGDDVDGEFADYLKTLTAFHIGGYIDYAISDQVSIQPGVTLSGKGYQLKGEEEGDSFADKTQLMYLEIPVNAVASFNAGVGTVFVGAGPYYAFALSGKNKWEYDFEGEIETGEEDVEFGSGEYETNRGDFGMNLLGGYRFANGFNLYLGYGFGFGNLVNTTGITISNRVFSIGAGFSF